MFEKINDRIIPGGLILTAVKGEWWHQIDLAILDSSSETDSVLGQLFGTKSEGLLFLGLTPAEADSHGFHVDTEAFPQFKEVPESEALAYTILDLGWSSLITGLRENIPAGAAA